ncbi:ExbD/TolR family protein [Fulvivirga sediminis]|uniref:Biopolymer transporter ExbD n=1 Tax=Fulvivirga sediminis TaxID=2803949 RepID=A0A937F9B9_9BACT|nr:biopolymer transporter ExbD [Fulvivirga sediminis]MBL3658085.1 biopolymer transporter ExbD [Fulvivirga sediminis]
MKSIIEKTPVQANAGSMADIAFLLLIFFMITTTIASDKGLTLQLPPDTNDQPVQKMHERNIFKILINSQDQLMIEGERRNTPYGLKEELKEFIMNHGKNKNLSDSPSAAVISIKTNRATTQQMFITILDAAKAAYYEVYAQRAGLTPEEYRKLGNTGKDKVIIQKASDGIPMNISIAEPD